MFKHIKIVLACLVISLMPVWLFGCAPQAAKTGFLKDYSKLTQHPDIEERFIYINPSMNVGEYSKFLVDPVAVNLSEEGKARETDPETLKELAQYFHEQIVEQLKEGGYQVINSAGPGVARARTSISDIKRAIVALNIHPSTKLSGAGLGQAGMEFELVDSASGKTIAAAIDHQKGSRLDIVGGMTWYGNAKSIMEDWAEDLKKFIDRGHGKTSS